MKLTKIKQNPVTETSKITKLKAVKGIALPTGDVVEVWHQQEIKLSQNYQSAGATYGIKLTVPNNQKSILEAIKRAEDLVEGPLTAKVQEQKELLATLA
jgi:hypothetical protein